MLEFCDPRQRSRHRYMSLDEQHYRPVELPGVARRERTQWIRNRTSCPRRGAGEREQQVMDVNIPAGDPGRLLRWKFYFVALSIALFATRTTPSTSAEITNSDSSRVCYKANVDSQSDYAVLFFRDLAESYGLIPTEDCEPLIVISSMDSPIKEDSLTSHGLLPSNALLFHVAADGTCGVGRGRSRAAPFVVIVNSNSTIKDAISCLMPVYVTAIKNITGN